MKHLLRFSLGIALVLMIFNNAFSQNSGFKYHLFLKSGQYLLPENFELVKESFATNQPDVYNEKIYRIIQFYELPSNHQKNELKVLGIELLNYLPSNAYFASIASGCSLTNGTTFKIRSISIIEPKYKMSADIFDKTYPTWAILENNIIELNVNYFENLSSDIVETELLRAGFEIIAGFPYSQLVRIRADINSIEHLASQPFIQFFAPIDPPSEPENLVGRTNHRSNAIATEYFMGRHYDGTGIKVAMGDDGIIGPHIDYQGRVYQTNVTSNSGDHGDHVAGTIMGAGNKDPKGRGMAFGADLYVYSVWDAINMTPTTNINPGIRITSTSYSDGCNTGYTSFAQTADKHMRQMPNLIHVFSAGNNGTSNCNYGAGAGWGNVTGGVKIGKNVIAVANLTSIDALASSSSRGPAHDGRIKPEVSAVGTDVYSTIDSHSYALKTGTSMACPGTSGTIAQLNHAYKALNNGIEPPSALIKGILMNSADDIGNPGPDFKHGFGRLNALKAVRIIESQQYLHDSISQGILKTHNILVPEGKKQLKIMIYWHDYEASVSASKALVNNLNMQVFDTASTLFNPWILDHTPNATLLNANAVRGVDSINNVEQVTIDNPVPGNYSIKVSGISVPMGPQTYFINYYFIDEKIEITYPIGGESFVPGETEIIRWDAIDNTQTFKLEYSTNDGLSWTTLSSSISASNRYFSWNIPSVVSGKVKLALSQGNQRDTTLIPFSIIGVPSNISVAWACIDSIKLTWNTVLGATSYEISKLGQKYMDSIGVSQTNSFVVSGINSQDFYWFSVKALGTNESIGRRAIAIQKTPGIFNCLYPYDIELSEISSPGKETFMNCQNITPKPITIKITNRGINTVTEVPLKVTINGINLQTDTFKGSLAPGGSAIFTFNSSFNQTAVGSYKIAAWTALPSDGYIYNDSAFVKINIIDGTKINLPWSENFESFTDCSTSANCELNICNLHNGFVNVTNIDGDDIDWRTDAGGTPSTGTGPSIDHNPGTSAGKYLYLEATGPCFAKEAFLLTPCIDLTNATIPVLSFWYHMYGTTMGSLSVDVMFDSKWTLNVVPTITGNKGDIWLRQLVNLSQFNGKVINIRFRGKTGSDYLSDLALDDFSILETVGMEESNFSDFRFSIYPNPGTGQFIINCIHPGENPEISIFNISGQQVFSQKNIVNNNNVQGSLLNTNIDVSYLPKGMYILKYSSSTLLKTEKIIIQ